MSKVPYAIYLSCRGLNWEATKVRVAFLPQESMPYIYRDAAQVSKSLHCGETFSQRGPTKASAKGSSQYLKLAMLLGSRVDKEQHSKLPDKIQVSARGVSSIYSLVFFVSFCAFHCNQVSKSRLHGSCRWREACQTPTYKSKHQAPKYQPPVHSHRPCKLRRSSGQWSPCLTGPHSARVKELLEMQIHADLQYVSLACSAKLIPIKRYLKSAINKLFKYSTVYAK